MQQKNEKWAAAPIASAQMTPEMFQVIADHILGNISVADREGNILFCNKAMAETFDCSVEEYMKYNVFTMHSGGILNRFAAAAECLNTGREVVRYITTKNGKMMMIQCRPVFDAQGQVEMVVGYSQTEEMYHAFLDRINEEKVNLQTTLQYLENSSEFFTESRNPAVRALYETAGKAAGSDSTVIIYGESGTGKEVLARYIHRSGSRARRAFIPVNCAAVPTELMESEFFGYEKGAFTGADARGKTGLFELADNSTLFLDEVGEMPLSMQSKLLRVLETGEMRRIGGGRTIRVNVRILAATNRDLRELVREGLFREDLYYRLSVIPLTTVPLRERREDILPLAEHFLQDYNRKYKMKKYFPPDTGRRLSVYSWPGNIRELKNFVERMTILSPSDCLTVRESPGGVPGPDTGIEYDVKTGIGSVAGPMAVLDDGPIHVPDLESAPREPGRRTIGENAARAETGMTLKEAQQEFQRRYIRETVRRCGGNISEAARQLGIHRSGIYRLMKEG